MIFYNKRMEGVNHADEMVTLYDLDRRSGKWWKKVFFRLLMTCVNNSYILSLSHNNSIYYRFPNRCSGRVD